MLKPEYQSASERYCPHSMILAPMRVQGRSISPAIPEFP
jgi:hypothetical protein